MECSGYPLRQITDLPLPSQDPAKNFRWAWTCRQRGRFFFQRCISKGCAPEYIDRCYNYLPIKTPPLRYLNFTDNEVREHYRLYMEEADKVDRLRNQVEDDLIHHLPISSTGKQQIRLHMRSYNCREMTRRVSRFADIECPQASHVTDIHTWKWELDFDDLVIRRAPYAADEANKQSDQHRYPSQVCVSNPTNDAPTRTNNDPVVSVRGPSRKKIRSDHVLLPEKIAVDPVIEQWYTDPYNRHDPQGLAGKALRRQVLTNALRNRGFRGSRIINIVNWLVRCRGRYKAYEDLVGTRKRKVKTPVEGRRSEKQPGFDTPAQTHPKRMHPDPASAADTENLTATDGSPRREHAHNTHGATPTARSSPVGVQSDHRNTSPDLEDGNDNPSIVPDKDPDMLKDLFGTDSQDEDQNEDEESGFYPFTSDTERELVMRQLKEEITGTRPAFRSSHVPGSQEYQDDYDDWRLEDLRRTLSFWNIIYGDDLDGPPNNNNNDDEKEEDITFTYFREPDGIPSVDIQYPSQGLKVSKRVTVNGKEVWTEDETFGLYVPPKHEKLN